MNSSVNFNDLADLKQFIPELVIQAHKNQFNLDKPDLSYNNDTSSYLCDFVNSLLFTLISCSNNRNNNNNLFINTDDLLADFNLSNKHNIQKNKENLKMIESGLIHNLIQFMSNIPNFIINVLYISNEYTPNDETFIKNVNTIEDYYKKNNYINASSLNDETPSYQICLILPKYEDDVITETNMQNRCAMKINHLLNRIQQLNANPQYRNAKRQSVGIVISSMELLSKNIFLTKKFWLSCPSKNLMHFLNVQQHLDLNCFLKYMTYMHIKWDQYKASFNQNSTFKFNHSLKQYILDIVVHLRMHRFSVQGRSGGIASISLNDMMQLSILIGITDNLLNKIQGSNDDTWIDSVKGEEPESENKAVDKDDIIITPDTIKTASRWYFPFKLQLTYKRRNNIKTRNFKKDYSVQYGSDVEIVDELINSLDDLSIKKRNGSKINGDDSGYPFYVELLVVEDVLKHVVPPF
ncbi:hypothetical protein ACO0SA_002178 [Hanseniaspora valbyensis]